MALDPRMGGHEQAALDHLVGVMEPQSTSIATRSVMVADTFAALEQARQLGRIADALEKIAGALMERDL